ncbi:MAG: response regulator transcription factor [Planctomycetota bacterium]|nr:response regulator transcription factor [Planctomycetota bacterium]MDG1984248.1 response regulator transcription factor [Planctomycetota bacterium]
MVTTNIRVLVVEEDPRERAELMAALHQEGHETEAALDLQGARQALQKHFDAIVLEPTLADGDGIELCRELRSAGRSIPLVIVSGRRDPEARIDGLNAGADDYVLKPYHLGEVIARVRSILRRSGRKPTGGFVRHLDLWIDLERIVAGRGERVIRLKPREFDLLSFLLRHPDRAWTRAELLDHVWGHDFRGDERTVDLHVRRLRSKLGDEDGNSDHIETVWSVGYRMRQESAVPHQHAI